VPDLPYDPIAAIARDGASLLAVATAAGVGAPVPACPGWNVGDLVDHVSEVWSFWSGIVQRRLTTIDEVRDFDDGRVPPTPEDRFACASSNLAELVRVLGEPDAAEGGSCVWTWTGANQPVSWVRRRMAQETAMHLTDALEAAGRPGSIDAPLAADGVDEFLTYFSGCERDVVEPIGGSTLLQATDQGLAWLVRQDDDRLVHDEVHGPTSADAIVSASSAMLLQWLWRRAAEVTIAGDPGVATRLHGFSTLD
jgi:uncharacterized protein (TIGR03083 family)